MRKDGKSQYQIKKEKLLKIKERLIKDTDKKNSAENHQLLWMDLWEIVEDEKDND